MSGAAGLIGGVVGAVIGFTLGNPQMGWMIGSSIGGFVGGGPKQAGPQLADLRPQASEYGRPIPIIYSVMAVGGNVIWAADLIKVSDGDSGGKGGSSPSGPRYAANFAILICESPDGVMGLGRIWAGPDKRLIYDPAGTTFESGALHFYNGAEDQMPDPLMEAALGAGNVPAYRGYAYIVVEMFDVTEHDGNRIPFLTIEVGRKGSAAPPELGQFFVDGLFMGSVSVVGSFWGTYFGTLQHSPEMAFMHRRDITLNEHGLLTVNLWDDARDTMIRVYRGGLTTDWLTTQQMGLGSYEVRTPFTVPSGERIAGGALNVGERLVIACRLTSTGGARFHFIDPESWAEVDTPLDYDDGSTELLMGIYSYGYEQGGVFGVTNAGKARFYALSGGGGASSDLGAAANVLGGLFAAVDPSTQSLWTVKLTAGLLHWSVHNAGGLIYSGSADAGFHDIARQPITFAPDGVYITGNHWLAVDHFAKFDKNTGELLSTFFGGYAGTSEIHAVIWNPITSRFIAYRENGYYSISATSSLETMPPSGPSLNGSDSSLQYQSLAEVVSDLSLRAGLAPEEFDVGELTDQVDGYILANQVSIRDAIATLMPVYYFDCVEDQGVLRFPKRGGDIVEEIPDEDLGVHGSDEDMVDLYETTRGQDEELPHTLNVNYVLAATKYSPATKYSRRLIGYSGDEARIELPMVLTDAKAQQVSAVNLHTQWVGRITYKLSLGRKYSHLMPTDLIGVQGYTLRLTKQTHKENGVIEFEAARDDADTYVPNIIVEETPPPDESVSQPSLTLLELM